MSDTNTDASLQQKKDLRFELLKGTCLGAGMVAALGLAVDGGMMRLSGRNVSLKDGFLQGLPYVMIGGLFNGMMSYVNAARHNDKIDVKSFVERHEQEKAAKEAATQRPDTSKSL